MAEFPTISHVALTVTDLSVSVPWYQQLFGSKPVLDEDTGPFRHVVWLFGGRTLVGLHQFPDPVSTEPFDQRRPGLDHLAFACANRDELLQWQARLNELGVPNGGVVDAQFGSGLSFRDPTTLHLNSSYSRNSCRRNPRTQVAHRCPTESCQARRWLCSTARIELTILTEHFWPDVAVGLVGAAASGRSQQPHASRTSRGEVSRRFCRGATGGNFAAKLPPVAHLHAATPRP